MLTMRGGFWRGRLQELFGIDLRSLALVRIGLGSLLLLDLANRARNLDAHYTDGGVLPRSMLETTSAGVVFPSVHLVTGSLEGQAALFLVAAACACALLVGYRTRVATAASWFLLVSLHTRNPLVLQGGDTVLRLLLFWSLFLPLGARFSIDRLLAANPSAGSGAGPRRIVSAATAALLLQVCFIYWFSAVLKTDPVWRSERTAIYYALSLDELVTPLGRALLDYPDLLEVLTSATLALEGVGPVVAFVPVFTASARLVIVPTFLLFHAGLALCLSLGLFPLVCGVAWLAFLPTALWDAVRFPRSRSRPLRRDVAPAVCRDVVPQPLTSPWVAQYVAVFFLGYILLWNVRAVALAPHRASGVEPNGRVDWIAALTRVDQDWALFAPRPPRINGWYVMAARLRDGSETDLFRNRGRGGTLTWEKPALAAATFGDYRWRKYLEKLRLPKHADLHHDYARYTIDRWNARHPANQHIQTLQIYFVHQMTSVDRRLSTPQRRLLWSSASVVTSLSKRSTSTHWERERHARSGPWGGRHLQRPAKARGSAMHVSQPLALSGPRRVEPTAVVRHAKVQLP